MTQNIIIFDFLTTNALSVSASLLPFALPLATTIVMVFMLGTIIGSFLNVVIYRLPREESIVFPGSHCGSCNAAVRPYDNIPILSYLVLRGRCRACRAAFSPRYLAVEALTGCVFVLVLLHAGLNLSLFFDLVFVSGLIALVFIDAEHMILPNAITYPGFAFALLTRLLVPNLDGLSLLADPETGVLGQTPSYLVSIIGALLGALVGGGSLWLVGWLWERLRGVEAMGLGDVKMMFAVGAYLGPPRTILTIFLAVLSGSIIGIGLMLRRGTRDMQMLLPFGIFLGIGALLSLLVGSQIIDWYVSLSK